MLNHFSAHLLIRWPNLFLNSVPLVHPSDWYQTEEDNKPRNVLKQTHTARKYCTCWILCHILEMFSEMSCVVIIILMHVGCPLFDRMAQAHPCVLLIHLVRSARASDFDIRWKRENKPSTHFMCESRCMQKQNAEDTCGDQWWQTICQWNHVLEICYGRLVNVKLTFSHAP